MQELKLNAEVIIKLPIKKTINNLFIIVLFFYLLLFVYCVENDTLQRFFLLLFSRFNATKINIFSISVRIFLKKFTICQYLHFFPRRLNCRQNPALTCLKFFTLACSLKCCQSNTSAPSRNSLPVYSAISLDCGKNAGLKVMPPTIPFHLALYPRK